MNAHNPIYRFLLIGVLAIAIGLVSDRALQTNAHANGDATPPEEGAVTDPAEKSPAEATSKKRQSSLFEDPFAEEASNGATAGDPWEKFNENMFSFNRGVDRWFLKPVATGYDFVLPDVVQIGVRNVISNIDVIRRLVNNLLQLKFGGAGREITRFTINSTIGIAGLIDVAKLGFHIDESDEDTGQTMGVWGVKPGPYLVLPFLPVMTVRDGVGSIFDRALNPLIYVGIFVDGATGVSIGTFTLNAINERSLNLETFEQVEDSVIDLYSAVRHAYLQSREAAIRE